MRSYVSIAIRRDTTQTSVENLGIQKTNDRLGNLYANDCS